MSISYLLDPATKDEAWKHLYVDQVSVNTVDTKTIGVDTANITTANITTAYIETDHVVSSFITDLEVDNTAIFSVASTNTLNTDVINPKSTADVKMNLGSGHLKLTGTNYPAGGNSILKLDSTNNVVPMSSSHVLASANLLFSGANVGIAYSTNQIVYSVVNNVVFFNINITLTNKGTSTGSATISGLPFVSSETALYAYNILSCTWSNMTFGTNYSSISPIVNTNSQSVLLYQNASVSAPKLQLDNTNFSNTSSLFISGFYFI